jgi:hypothetical protein
MLALDFNQGAYDCLLWRRESAFLALSGENQEGRDSRALAAAATPEAESL